MTRFREDSTRELSSIPEELPKRRLQSRVLVQTFFAKQSSNLLYIRSNGVIVGQFELGICSRRPEWRKVTTLLRHPCLLALLNIPYSQLNVIRMSYHNTLEG